MKNAVEFLPTKERELAPLMEKLAATITDAGVGCCAMFAGFFVRRKLKSTAYALSELAICPDTASA
jgi:hypothetical protein